MIVTIPLIVGIVIVIALIIFARKNPMTKEKWMKIREKGKKRHILIHMSGAVIVLAVIGLFFAATGRPLVYVIYGSLFLPIIYSTALRYWNRYEKKFSDK